MVILAGEAVRADGAIGKRKSGGVEAKQITPILGVIYKK